MKRLTEKTVFLGLITAWRLAMEPTRRLAFCAKATTDGVVRSPSALRITVGQPPSITAMQLSVVPRSIPIVFAIRSDQYSCTGQRWCCLGRRACRLRSRVIAVDRLRLSEDGAHDEHPPAR